jgi:hypothetical protein
MFMAGFGEELPAGAIDNGDGSYRNADGTTGYFDRDTGIIEDPTRGTRASEEDAPPTGPSTWELIQSYGKDAADAVNKALPTINALVNTGLSYAAAVEKATGIKIPGLPTTPPVYVPAPSPQPVYATPAQQMLNLMQQQGTAFVQPMTIKPGTREAIQVAQAKSSTTMYLILGAVAIGAVLLLKKK